MIVPGAIDAWSRILLIDHTHEEALDRIEHIRHAKEDIDGRIEPMLAEIRWRKELDENLVRIGVEFLD